jgi:hypothetical protein
VFFGMKTGRTARERHEILLAYITEPRNWNRYAYCVNDPLNLIDPSGLIWLTNDDENYTWVPDELYNEEEWDGYTPVKAGTIVFFAGGTSDYEEKYKELQGKYVTLNADGTLGDAGVRPTSDPDWEAKFNVAVTTFMQMTTYHSTVVPDVAPAYVQVEVDTPGPPLTAGLALALTLDRYGNTYRSTGAYAGTPGFNVSLGWLAPNSSSENIEGFITGHSVGGSAISKYWVGAGVTRASGKYSPQLMVGTPGISGSYLYTFKDGNIGRCW